MSLDFGLKDVHVLVTGAAGGIGLDIVKTFGRLGAKVTAHYNSSIGELASIPDIVSLQADVRQPEAVGRLFAEAAEKNGSPVSVLVVNHGVFPENESHIRDLPLAQWLDTLSINLTGPFLLSQAYLQGLSSASAAVKSSANIIFIGSTAGKFGEANHGDYASSKAAIMFGLMPTLKNEIVAIAPKGRVNCVNPGWTKTKMAEAVLGNEAFVQRALASTPLQKVAMTSDVARQVAVLASPVLSGHVSGMNVMVDGGMEGRLLFPPTRS